MHGTLAALREALSIINKHLHPLFDSEGRMPVGHSKASCILCALTVRDFLHEIGITDAIVQPVAICIEATINGETSGILTIGHPQFEPKPDPNRWHGHMVNIVPSHNLLIDTTLYQARRPKWPKLPGIVSAKLRDESFTWHGLRAICGVVIDNHIRVIWFSRTATSWRDTEAARDTSLRKNVVRQLSERYSTGYSQ